MLCYTMRGNLLSQTCAGRDVRGLGFPSFAWRGYSGKGSGCYSDVPVTNAVMQRSESVARRISHRCAFSPSAEAGQRSVSSLSPSP